MQIRPHVGMHGTVTTTWVMGVCMFLIMVHCEAFKQRNQDKWLQCIYKPHSLWVRSWVQSGILWHI